MAIGAMRTSGYSAIDYLPDSVREFLRKRAAELTGALLLAGTLSTALALVTWSVRDPSLNHATDGGVHNLLGPTGAIVADLITQIAGIASVAMLIPPVLWGWRLIARRKLERIRLRIILWLIGIAAAAALASLMPVTDRWPLPTGLGGVLGDKLLAVPRWFLGDGAVTMILLAAPIAAVALLSITASGGYGLDADDPEEDPDSSSPRDDLREDEDLAGRPGWGIVSVGAIIHVFLKIRATADRLLFSRLSRLARSSEGLVRTEPRLNFDENYCPPVAVPERGFPDSSEESPRARGRDPADLREPSLQTSRVESQPPPPKPGKRVAREAQPSLIDRESYSLPAIAFLSEARRQAVSKVSEDALEQNARLLEGVLEDFGVKGEIIKVRPGPVVTLYELEPAPGIKSSRVIGLADDVARSMSAVSARVAVVQGRNVIGIELPNQRREMVYLRELLACEDFEKTKHRLAIALGKTIGGEPVVVDLARMPHLLVAGTTGSGKSVAINTMILSLLYRLRPEECRLIMVDPKMLELSVYDGIPHLLTPVVTDPKKAVVALKWAVREMEDRYKKMSRLGVRNIDGFNARVADAKAKGESIKRTVQTGFSRETGEAVYEEERLDLEPLPYIVVVVDEMADLMLVAGKDIEGAIQRLAQMARAAGIHLIMATQRPSVDVITGTIKANFPTRISFQVTSKIDSRTILGEQGAEQLLGQGDMLYMAGGGRISRVHGPFVSDAEVEKVVAHLKSQGQPDYLESITEEEPSDEPGASGQEFEESGDLYDRAVAIVLHDRKCSTSYIQRRLSVGYNKAASLVERMEKEGVVSAANHAGKREILVGRGIDRGAFEPEALD
jgi:DNA segregation ATPase FtsK/SpoIIIE, S-DNA-T family